MVEWLGMTDKAKRVLVVDDDEGVCDLLAFVIKKEGHLVDTATDGEIAHRKINAAPPDLMVLDLMLPRYGGFELLRQLQNSDLRALPIIVITGRYTDPSTAEMIRHESNVIDLLEKPIKTPHFVAVMKKIFLSKPSGPVQEP